MIDWAKPIQLADGQPLRYVDRYIDHSGEPVIIAARVYCKGEQILHFDENGDPLNGFTPACNVKTKRRGAYYNCYEHRLSGRHATRDEADKHALDNRTACIYVEWHDGDGL